MQTFTLNKKKIVLLNLGTHFTPFLQRQTSKMFWEECLDGQKQINCKDMKTTKELARWDLETFQVRHSHSHDIMIINVIITKVFVVIVITHIYLNIFFFYRELGLLRQRRNAGNDRFSKKRPRSNCKKYPSCYCYYYSQCFVNVINFIFSLIHAYYF